MIVSWNWLAQYVRLDMSVQVLTERLALTGLNHESTNDEGGDLAIDLEVTSNRPDCLGHLGIAREISVVFNTPLTRPDPRPPESGPAVETLTSVTVESPELCPYFTARVVTGAKIGPSPWWLKQRLETVGVRPVSNVVDVTNYVMLECGQPLHAYDLDLLAERRLIVRRARAGDRIQAINEKIYELDREMLVIADGGRPVGLAGVMGGRESEIHAATSNILIEAACFDPMSVRRTARALGLHSPSSFRFERGIDSHQTEWASRRCAELILETAGGTLHPGVIHAGTLPPARPPITLRLSQIPRVLGIEIAPDECARILRALGLEPIDTKPPVLTFRPPSWRADLDREIDLIEEVARIHGYEHIPEDRGVPLVASARRPRERAENAIRETLCACGLSETITMSLVADDRAVPFGAPESAARVEPLRVVHSSRKKESALRRSVIESLLAARALNESRGNPGAELFEFASVYIPTRNGKIEEPTKLGILVARGFLEQKAILELLLARLHISATLDCIPCPDAIGLTPGRAANLRLDGRHWGYLGEVDPAWLARYDLRGDCSAAEVDLDPLISLATLVPQARGIAPFPAVERDLSLVLSTRVPWAELDAAVREAAGPHLESLEFLDTFSGGSVPPGSHSMHFGMRFRHPERTLTGDEVERAVQNVVAHASRRLSAALRA